MVESGEERVDRHSVRLEQSGVKEEWSGGDIRKPPPTRRTPPWILEHDRNMHDGQHGSKTQTHIFSDRQYREI